MVLDENYVIQKSMPLLQELRHRNLTVFELKLIEIYLSRINSHNPDSRTVIFEKNELKVPHMGWDIVEIKRDHRILSGLRGQQRFYFVHSYHAVCDSNENVLMTCDYGYEFAAAVVQENIIGVQFHPEKSHDFGMRLLENFVKKC